MDLSSSGEDSDSESRKRKPESTRYHCPADFISCAYKPCSSALLENICGADVELCLIKAPASFDPQSFSGLKIPLKGLQTFQAKAGNLQTTTYSVLSNPAGAVDMHLLTASSSLDGMVCGPSFSRIVNICESFGDSLGNQTLTALPAAAAAPAPCIPEGATQRFHPFGSRSATVAASTPSSPKQMGLDETEGKKKKKKKKDKVKTEEEEKSIWEEDSSQSVEVPQSLEGEEVARSKKRRKKDKERGKKNTEGLLTGFYLNKEINVKPEPIDSD